jgi:hypothetical protein
MPVIPAKAGIQRLLVSREKPKSLDPSFRWDDGEVAWWIKVGTKKENAALGRRFHRAQAAFLLAS